MKGLKIKVCGMCEPGNIRDISALLPDYMGFIFFPGSKRYAGGLSPEIRAEIPAYVKKVGVFVGEEKDRLLEICSVYGISTVQLHGDESPGYCEELAGSGLRIIKAFRIGEKLDPSALKPFEKTCSYFLFDTRTDRYGGSGIRFDWELLDAYSLEVPFFLSGGIGPQDPPRIRMITHPLLFGVDINSRFEMQPGMKDPAICEKFIRDFRNPDEKSV